MGRGEEGEDSCEKPRWANVKPQSRRVNHRVLLVWRAGGHRRPIRTDVTRGQKIINVIEEANVFGQ